jgi:hypothetical protein
MNKQGSLFIILRPVAAAAAMALGFSTLALAGEWTTTYGIMQLPDKPMTGNIQTSYSQDNGKLIGEMAIPKCAGCGPEIKGIWTENSSSQACSTQKYGSSHWGKVTLNFTGPYSSFSGKWDYCGEGNTRSWNGSLGRKRSTFQDR